jgi:hypothetical protein
MYAGGAITLLLQSTFSHHMRMLVFLVGEKCNAP